MSPTTSLGAWSSDMQVDQSPTYSPSASSPSFQAAWTQPAVQLPSWRQQQPTPERQPLGPVDMQAPLAAGHFAPQWAGDATAPPQTRGVTLGQWTGTDVQNMVLPAHPALALPINIRRMTASQLEGCGKAASSFPFALAGLPTPARNAGTPLANTQRFRPLAQQPAGNSPVTPSPAGGRTTSSSNLPNFPSPGPLGSPIGGAGGATVAPSRFVPAHAHRPSGGKQSVRRL
ncbi:unnamed protein product [Polarella glacialis]|uniref:Uncharacterized protein n=1 Tax=Polarella glacialis TaxID=89957 RepID=A0A813HTH4_POLGL|nr:unnamed protein product [Polarella glacialis]